jgi:proprotein convertase subtilisin/kexin type 5
MTFADPQTANRYCVLQCTQTPNEAFADPSSRTCVPICPTTPSLFGERTTFTCVATCPNGTYANTHNRLCMPTCTGQFKLASPNQCVSVCPADQAVPLYGDPFTGFCVASCSNSYFRYKSTSMCVDNCMPYGLFSFNMICVNFCP